MVSGMVTRRAFFFLDSAFSFFGLEIFCTMAAFLRFSSFRFCTSARRFRSAAAASFASVRTSATWRWQQGEGAGVREAGVLCNCVHCAPV